MIEKMGKPIVRINAENTGKGKNSTANQANGLDSHLFL